MYKDIKQVHYRNYFQKKVYSSSILQNSINTLEKFKLLRLIHTLYVLLLLSSFLIKKIPITDIFTIVHIKFPSSTSINSTTAKSLLLTWMFIELYMSSDYVCLIVKSSSRTSKHSKNPHLKTRSIDNFFHQTT